MNPPLLLSQYPQKFEIYWPGRNGGERAVHGETPNILREVQDSMLHFVLTRVKLVKLNFVPNLEVGFDSSLGFNSKSLFLRI